MKKLGEWQTGIAEKLVVGRNGVVCRAKVRTIKDGKPMPVDCTDHYMKLKVGSIRNQFRSGKERNGKER
jgi:hypothetical protein